MGQSKGYFGLVYTKLIYNRGLIYWRLEHKADA